MSRRTPREGARWGDDPVEPTPPPQAKIIDPYQKLCEKYGEQNAQRALDIYNHIKHDYPHVFFAKQDPNKVSGDILELSEHLIRSAAQDGRPHSMSETLDLLESTIGNQIVSQNNIDRISNISIIYGDEHNGINYQNFKKYGLKIRYIFLFIWATPPMIAFFYLMRKNLNDVDYRLILFPIVYFFLGGFLLALLIKLLERQGKIPRM